MLITTADLKTNLEYYLEASQSDAILIMHKGQFFARLIGAQQSKQETFAALQGILPEHSELAEIKESRIIAGND